MNNYELIGDEATARQLIENDLSETDGRFEDDLVSYIRDQAFKSMTSLKYINLPNVTTIRANAFSGCSLLRNVTFPKATDCYYDGLFDGCSRLDYADFVLISQLRQTVFQSNYWLRDLVLRNTNGAVSLINTTTFNSCPIKDKPQIANVYVPDDLITTYQSASQWSTYYASNSDLFKPLEDYTVDGTVTGAMNWSLIDALPTPIYSVENQNFNGSSDYIDTGVQLFDSLSPAFTIVCDFDWPEQTTVGCGLFHCGTDSTGIIKFSRDGSGSSMYATYKPPGISSTHGEGLSGTTFGKRYQLAWTIYGGLSTHVRYEQGVDMNVRYGSRSNPTSTLSNTLIIGRSAENRYYKGTVHRFKVFNKVLNARQIRTVLGIS